jgi:hypothetical protein
MLRCAVKPLAGRPGVCNILRLAKNEEAALARGLSSLPIVWPD